MEQRDAPATSSRKTTPAAPPGGLTPYELHGLKVVAGKAKKWREQLAVGEHPIDVVVRIDGILYVAADQHQPKRDPPELFHVLGFVLARLGPKTRQKCLLELSNAFFGGAVPPPPPAEVLAQVTQFLELATLEKQMPKRGNVTGRLNFTRYPRPGEPVR